MTPPPNPPTDPEAMWPPRFDGGYLAWTGLMLLVVFGVLSSGLYGVFLESNLVDKDAASEDVAGFVLFLAALAALLTGVFFALVEARRPPTQPLIVVKDDPRLENVNEATANVADTVGKVIDSFKGQRVSTVMFSAALVLAVLAATGLGLIDVSVGSDSGADTDQGGEPADATEVGASNGG